MTEISRPWSGQTALGDPGDAGPYSHINWRDIFRYSMGLYSADSGVLVDSGVVPDPGLTVQQQSPLAAGVTLTPGRALVQGTFYENDANLNFSIAPNVSGQTRIDTLILRRDDTAQTVRAAILQGTPAASPVPPTLTRAAGVYEIAVADITVLNGFATISNSVILNRRMYANASNGLYHTNVQNRSGGTLQTGDVVLWDGSNDRAVVAPGGAANRGSHNVAGVWIGRTDNLGYGRVLYDGIGYVRTTAGGSRLQALQQSATAKVAEVPGSGSGFAAAGRQLFAYALETPVTGYTLCAVNARPAMPFVDAGVLVIANAGNNTTASAAFTDLLLGGNALEVYSAVLTPFIAFSVTVSHSVANAIIAFDIAVNGVDHGAVDHAAQDGVYRAPITTANVPVGASWAGAIFNASGRVTGALNQYRLRWRTGAATATVYNAAAVAGQDAIAQFSLLNTN